MGCTRVLRCVVLMLVTCAVVSAPPAGSPTNTCSDGGSCAPEPRQVVLELSDVRFPSRPNEAFRAELAVTDLDLPMRVWLESKMTKQQWECVVRDLQTHASQGANYVLPPNVVATSLHLALAQRDAGNDVAVDSGDCSVDLSATPTVVLTLTLKAFASFQAEYTFEMVPLKIATTDVLEAKIRDLENAVARAYGMIEALQGHANDKIKALEAKLVQVASTVGTHPPILASFTSSARASHYQKLQWTQEGTDDTTKYFSIAWSNEVVSIHKGGVYHISVVGNVSGHSGGQFVHLLINGTLATTSRVHQVAGTNEYAASMHHVVPTLGRCTVAVRYISPKGYQLQKGATVTILMLQEFATPYCPFEANLDWMDNF